MADTGEVPVGVYLNKCCRLCLVADEKQQYGNIFKRNLPTKNSVSIAEALQQVTGLDVSSDTRLPERICDDCCRKLEDAFHFINEVVSNNVVLIDMVNSETITREQTAGFVLELGDNSESEPPGGTAPEVPARKQREKTPGSVDGESSGTCSDGELNADELDAVNLILKNFSNQPDKKSRASYGKTQAKTHKCAQCEKVFHKKSNLIDHERLHSQTKLFQCEYCDKSFVQSGNLNQHLRTHTAEKPYSCNVCSKTFSQSGALKTHMNIHLQLRPFECSKCRKAFTSSSDLHKHMYTHDRKKRFCCPMCSDRVFTQKVHLRMHLTRMHPRCNVEEMVTRGTMKNNGVSQPTPPRNLNPTPTRLPG
ncbi:zinc finger protein 878-like [Anopheles aquasalis]|uniref:zinc finger protein 878-like n=1 Tax=Anopheles aquasalis TaxID=42839 RepID=UPI00215AF0B4|nr:zinc finger protein 878-like [Anopheles aquasalis]